MIPNLLTEYRKKASLTQKQVGESIGISAQAVSKWENGQSEPDIDTLCKLAELYGVSVNTLIGKDPAPDVPPETPTEVPPEAPRNNKKKLMILIASLSVILISAVMICIFLFGSQGSSPETLLEKYDQITLGMTMDEVRAIFGKPDHTHAEYLKGTSSLGSEWEEAMSLVNYGYYNADFWYYHSQSFYENEEAMNQVFTDPDLDYEMQPYTKLRIAFKDGVVIEAYYQSDIKYDFYGDDYDCKEDKTVASVTYLEEIKYNELNPIRITYTDGSIFLGKLTVSKGSQGKYNATFPELGEHPWGAITYTDSQIVASVTE